MQSIRSVLIVAMLNAGASVTLATPGGQPDSRGLIELALDEPARVALENVKLSDAIQAIWDQTGVRVVMPPEVMKLVPYGGETVIERVEIADMPLRDGLIRIFAPLGMTFVARDKYVEIVAKESLRCLGRRPTWDELETLGELSAMQPGVDANALSQLRSRVQFRVPVPDGWTALARVIESVGAGPGDEVLGVACSNLGWTWCVSGRQVVITPAAERIRLRLEQPISLRMNYKLLIDVLQEVGSRAGVTVRVEPNALASLPLNVRNNFSLNVYQRPAEDVLNAIAANTGLGYLLEPDGVLFYRIEDTPKQTTAGAESAPAAKRGRDPYVGKIVVQLEDGKTVEWLVRQSELPPDLRQRRQEDLQEAFDALRR